MMEDVEIIPYTAAHQPVFKMLNLEWLDAYNLTESHDLMVLDDPQKTILDNGGVIFLARHNDTIVGSAALVKEHEDVYELAKMAVTKGFQGKGISKMLIEKCLSQAVQFQAKKLTLFSNHQLETALHLYQKYGFRHVEVKDSPFETADVKMELIL
jgi:GNAT superfamily N-acetyltransferase